MSSYILVVKDNRFALSTRSIFHLDINDSFWSDLAKSNKYPDFDIRLNSLLSGLHWIDFKTAIKKKVARFGFLTVCFFNYFGQRMIQFGVLENDAVQFITSFELDECDQVKMDTVVGRIWRPEDILSVWAENYQQALRRRCNFAEESWHLRVWHLARQLFDQAQYDDVGLLFECAIARAQLDGEQNAVEEFLRLKDELLRF